MAKRRIVLKDNSNGFYGQGPHTEIDASDIPYNNAMVGMFAVVQEQCNLGHWHETQSVIFAPWGDD